MLVAGAIVGLVVVILVVAGAWLGGPVRRPNLLNRSISPEDWSAMRMRMRNRGGSLEEEPPAWGSEYARLLERNPPEPILIEFHGGKLTVCPYCKGGLSGDLRLCPKCNTLMHKECIVENGGCAVYGCV